MITSEGQESIFFTEQVEENLIKTLNNLKKEDFFKLRNDIYSNNYKTVSYDPFEKKIIDDYVIGIGYPLYLDSTMTISDFIEYGVESIQGYFQTIMNDSNSEQFLDDIVNNDLPAWDVSPNNCERLISKLITAYYINEKTPHDVCLPDYTVKDHCEKIKDNLASWNRKSMISSLSGLPALYFLKEYKTIARVLSDDGKIDVDDIEYIDGYFDSFIRENYYFRAEVEAI